MPYILIWKGNLEKDFQAKEVPFSFHNGTVRIHYVSNSKAILYDEVDVLNMPGFKYIFILERLGDSLD